MKTSICRFLWKNVIFLLKVGFVLFFFFAKKLLYFTFFVLETCIQSLLKKQKIPGKNFENLEKSWNFVGQPQWEPWISKTRKRFLVTSHASFLLHWWTTITTTVKGPTSKQSINVFAGWTRLQNERCQPFLRFRWMPFSTKRVREQYRTFVHRNTCGILDIDKFICWTFVVQLL